MAIQHTDPRPTEDEMPTSFQTAPRPHYPPYGRRYSLRIAGDLHAPIDLMDWDDAMLNPNNLKRDCRIVADRAAVALGVEVEIVKHLATGERVEGWAIAY